MEFIMFLVAIATPFIVLFVIAFVIKALTLPRKGQQTVLKRFGDI